MLRFLVGCVVVASLFVTAGVLFAAPATEGNAPVAPAATVAAPTAPVTAQAAPVAAPVVLDRQTIRQMPLLMRPNRPGHFYGNTVRRLYYGRHGG